MNHKKHGLGFAGLLAVAALGVMAFASTAQAAIEPDFRLNSGSVSLHVTLKGNQTGEGTLLVAPLNAEVKCGTFTVTSGLLESNDKGTGSILFENCEWWEHNAPLNLIANCHIIAGAADFKLHITATGTFLPTELLGGPPYQYAVLVENISALIRNLTGTGCTLPSHSLVTGELCLKMDNNHATNLLLLSNATIQGECVPKVLNALGDPNGTKVKDELKYGIHTAYVDTHVTVFPDPESPHSAATLGVLLL